MVLFGDVTVGALGSCAEAQGARATLIRGHSGVYTVSTHPYSAYGTAGPVTGASTGLWGNIKKVCHIRYDKCGKGVHQSIIKGLKPALSHIHVALFGILESCG